jgi:hypothetical protein
MSAGMSFDSRFQCDVVLDETFHSGPIKHPSHHGETLKRFWRWANDFPEVCGHLPRMRSLRSNGNSNSVLTR